MTHDIGSISRRRLLQCCAGALAPWASASPASQSDRQTQFLVARDGRKLCFAEWGPPDGSPVVLLHGSPGSRLGVTAQTEAILDELSVRLITYDRPGYGQSTRRGSATRVVDHVEDVRAIVDRLGVTSFSITGGSGGAPHALAVAALLPERVVRVTNWGPLVPFELIGLDEYQRDEDQDTRDYLFEVRKSEAACSALFSKLDAETKAALTPGNPRRKVILEQTRQGVAGWVDDERALQKPWGFDLAKVRASTVIYSNPMDTTTPPNLAGWLVAHLPDARLVSSTNALGHAAIKDSARARRADFTWLIHGGTPIVP